MNDSHDLKALHKLPFLFAVEFDLQVNLLGEVFTVHAADAKKVRFGPTAPVSKAMRGVLERHKEELLTAVIRILASNIEVNTKLRERRAAQVEDAVKELATIHGGGKEEV